MKLARIDGNVTSTVHHPSLKGCRLLICQPIDEQDNDMGCPVIAIDTLGAGQHAKVFFTTDGSFTRETANDEHSPLRNMVIGIVDDPSKQTAC